MKHLTTAVCALMLAQGAWASPITDEQPHAPRPQTYAECENAMEDAPEKVQAALRALYGKRFITTLESRQAFGEVVTLMRKSLHRTPANPVFQRPLDDLEIQDERRNALRVLGVRDSDLQLFQGVQNLDAQICHDRTCNTVMFGSGTIRVGMRDLLAHVWTEIKEHKGIERLDLNSKLIRALGQSIEDDRHLTCDTGKAGRLLRVLQGYVAGIQLDDLIVPSSFVAAYGREIEREVQAHQTNASAYLYSFTKEQAEVLSSLLFLHDRGDLTDAQITPTLVAVRDHFMGCIGDIYRAHAEFYGFAKSVFQRDILALMIDKAFDWAQVTHTPELSRRRNAMRQAVGLSIVISGSGNEQNGGYGAALMGGGRPPLPPSGISRMDRDRMARFAAPIVGAHAAALSPADQANFREVMGFALGNTRGPGSINPGVIAASLQSTLNPSAYIDFAQNVQTATLTHSPVVASIRQEMTDERCAQVLRDLGIHVPQQGAALNLLLDSNTFLVRDETVEDAMD